MKEFAYTPQPVERVLEGKVVLDEEGKPVTDPSLFKGEIILKIPKYAERLKLVGQLAVNIESDGQVKTTKETMAAAIKMAEIAQEHIVSLKVENVETKEVYASFDDLEYDQDGTALINECANVVVNGIRMGKRPGRI